MSKMIWEKTKTQFLLRDKISGRYYCRLYANNKQHWHSLGTDSISVAKARLAAYIKEFRAATSIKQTVEQGTATVEQLAQAYLEAVHQAVDIKPSTVHYREQLVKAILKKWPDLSTSQPKDISETDCTTWAKRFSSQYSPTRYNNAVDTLRGIFQIAIDRGMIYRNPAEKLGKRKPNGKHLQLPNRERFAEIVRLVRSEGAWCSQQCGDLIEFLAYSGCRLVEAKHVKWTAVEQDGIWIHGSETGTKNSERRFVPIIPAMRRLLDDLKGNPRYVRTEARQGYVLAVCECQKALDKACATVGVKRMTHHDLRHLFVTRCIESSVDVPTVAKFAGHKDGGALLMRTYSHLLKDHAQAMAAKVTF
jgi:integrase